MTRPIKNPKTAEQLRSEIGYYSQRLQQTRSPDRIRRAHVAIRRREKLLTQALEREAAALRRREERNADDDYFRSGTRYPGQ